jgi:hypothetical protein
MATSPAFPTGNDDKYDPFLNDGDNELILVDAFVKEGPANDPIPSHVFKLKVVSSTNPMNAKDVVHEVRIKCRGFSWHKGVQAIVSAAGVIPKVALSNQVVDGLYASGRLKNRKLKLKQTTETAKSGATFRTYEGTPLESTPVI